LYNEWAEDKEMVQVTPLRSTLTHALVAISKGMWAVILLQQNPPVFNWGYWLMQIALYNGRKTVAVVVVADNGLISNN